MTRAAWRPARARGSSSSRRGGASRPRPGGSRTPSPRTARGATPRRAPPRVARDGRCGRRRVRRQARPFDTARAQAGAGERRRGRRSRERRGVAAPRRRGAAEEDPGGEAVADAQRRLDAAAPRATALDADHALSSARSPAKMGMLQAVSARSRAAQRRAAPAELRPRRPSRFSHKRLEARAWRRARARPATTPRPIRPRPGAELATASARRSRRVPLRRRATRDPRPVAFRESEEPLIVVSFCFLNDAGARRRRTPGAPSPAGSSRAPMCRRLISAFALAASSQRDAGELRRRTRVRPDASRRRRSRPGRVATRVPVSSADQRADQIHQKAAQIITAARF